MVVRIRWAGAATALLLWMMPATAREPRPGEMAPPFELTLVDGTKLRSDTLSGQVIVLNYWATWCGPCRRELPTLDAYYEAQRSHGLRVFAVATEDSLPVGQLRQLFGAMRLTPVRRINGPFHPINDAMPTNFVIGRDGRVRYAQAGAFDLGTLNTVLVPLLREQAPPS
ncbi:TlpA family protein disulfide reductase [Sphingomonas sp.]|uniref:TlpA family protein disulfide reductase n=1 Tax=Sphingomonas sp. TaxID=28214 RepID=UPI003CC6544F